MLRRVILLAIIALLAACGGTSPPVAEEPLPDLFLPDGGGTVPLVVLVPGGGWSTADPTGLTGLAEHLADDGSAAALARIRAATDGVRYPVPVEDVLCEVASATAEVRAQGYDPDPVVVLGHSSGAHLAALAVLTASDHPASCPHRAVVPDALIGISGPYDISRLPDVAVALMGSTPEEEPDAWTSANPVAQAHRRPRVPVLLLHGADDTTVPVDFTRQLARALRRGGHPTTVEVLPGVDHQMAYAAAIAGPPVARWLEEVSGG